MRSNAATNPRKVFSTKNEVPVKRKWIARVSDYPEADKLPDPFAFSEDWIKGLDIEEQFAELVHYSCDPGVHHRGQKWRLHINVSTNIWADASTIKAALRRAMKLWAENRRPTRDSRGVELWVQEQIRDKDTKYVKVWRVL